MKKKGGDCGMSKIRHQENPQFHDATGTDCDASVVDRIV
jgi:hypothetical protein